MAYYQCFSYSRLMEIATAQAASEASLHEALIAGFEVGLVDTNNVDSLSIGLAEISDRVALVIDATTHLESQWEQALRDAFQGNPSMVELPNDFTEEVFGPARTY